MHNWAGNYEFQAATFHEPASVEEVQRLVGGAVKVHAAGKRHSFSAVADAPGGALLSLRKMNRVLAIDKMAGTVTVEGGILYGELGPVLHREGLMLANLASLPHITVAGAVATATHGSGERNRCLAANVAAMDIVKADGSVWTVRRGEADFNGAVVSLGALGVVTRLTLDVVPAQEMAQHVYLNTPIDVAADAYDAIVGGAYSVSIFTTWQRDVFEQIWVKNVSGRGHFDVTMLGATAAKQPVHPIGDIPGAPAFTGLDPANCTQQLGVPGPWYERLPHFRLDHMPSAGEELQSEFFVPRQHVKAAIAAMRPLKDDLRPVIMVSEIRTIAADELWLSPFYARDSVGFHFTWRRDPTAVAAVASKIEAALAPFDARPHWAKVFTMPKARIEAMYPRLGAFQQLRRRVDPTEKFGNAFTQRHL